MLPPERVTGAILCGIDRTPPCGGRGMSRFIAICGICWRDGVPFPGRPTDPIADGGLGTLRVAMAGLPGAWLVIAPGLEPIRIGGRGTGRPAGEGVALATDGLAS